MAPRPENLVFHGSRLPRLGIPHQDLMSSWRSHPNFHIFTPPAPTRRVQAPPAASSSSGKCRPANADLGRIHAGLPCHPMLGVAPAGDDLGGDHFDGAGLNTVGCARNLAERNDSTRLDTNPCLPAGKHMPTKIMRLKKRQRSRVRHTKSGCFCNEPQSIAGRSTHKKTAGEFARHPC